MEGYYQNRLSSHRLQRVYDLAPPRVRQYLEAEIDFVLARIKPGSAVLDLGCGCGRVFPELLRRAALVVGIDTALDSLRMARASSKAPFRCTLLAMDAAALGISDRLFDAVICIQNGISAFHVDRKKLVSEAVRVCRPGGLVLFSTYSERFWKDRLDWFRLQAREGLIGEIDEEATGSGVIVCKDGFRAAALGPRDFQTLAAELGLVPIITEVDRSSLFCEIRVV